MGAQAKVKVQIFSREDAWELFCEEAGSTALLPKVQPSAKNMMSGYIDITDEMLPSEAYEKGLHLLKELLDGSTLELSKIMLRSTI